MHRYVAIIAASVLVLGSACRSEKPAASGGSAGGSAGESARGSAQSPPSAVGQQPQPSASAAAASPSVRVGVGRTPELGVFLTDGNGRSLYLLEEDGAGESTCYEMCAAIWPPLLAGTATPTPADPTVRANLLGTIARRGGGSQVTYNGHPLYYYLGDAAPGQTRGQHVEDSWGEWYLVSPAGRHVGEDGSGRRGRRGRRGEDDR
jgi:predicted lipoprotein with Yx(FWY)xxD motif